MTVHELFDLIQTWNTSLYDPNLGNVVSPLDQQKWDNGMLKNASELEVVPALTGSPVEDDLRKAIYYAKTFDRANLKEIRDLLGRVQKYMYQNGLT